MDTQILARRGGIAQHGVSGLDFLGKKYAVVVSAADRFMAIPTDLLSATKVASTFLMLFIPSNDRDDVPIDQDDWLNQTLTFLGTFFGGATAFPQGKGVYRDDSQGGKLLFDKP
jgi:hypothetical protein